MLKMRLQRVGRKHEPTFRLVLTDSENSTKSGRFAEVLGSYDPRKLTESFKVERIKELMTRGVGLTDSVNNLLIKKGIIRGKKAHVGANFVPTVVEEAPVAEPVVEEAVPEAPVEAAPESAPEPEPATEAPVAEPEEPKSEEAPAPSPEA